MTTQPHHHSKPVEVDETSGLVLILLVMALGAVLITLLT